MIYVAVIKEFENEEMDQLEEPERDEFIHQEAHNQEMTNNEFNCTLCNYSSNIMARDHHKYPTSSCITQENHNNVESLTEKDLHVIFFIMTSQLCLNITIYLCIDIG